MKVFVKFHLGPAGANLGWFIFNIFCVGLLGSQKGPIGFDEICEKPMVFAMFLPQVHAKTWSYATAQVPMHAQNDQKTFGK